MIERIAYNVAVDFTGMLGLVLIIISSVDRDTFRSRKPRHVFKLFLVLFFMLLTELIACSCFGRPRYNVLMYASFTANFALFYLILMELFTYLIMDLGPEMKLTRHISAFVYGSGLLMMAGVLLNPVHREFFTITQSGLLQWEPLHILMQVHSALVLVGALVLIFLKKGVSVKRRLISACYISLPLVSALLPTRVLGITLTSPAALLSALIVFANHYVERNRAAAEKELELENARAALILSQIQPHFLFNSMATVMNLCDKDPQEAKAAMQELSDYLHYKLSAMSNNHVVAFSEDLDFVKNYLKLEKRRYGDRLQVEYDIRCEDFRIPLLTLQPMVENAIRHGISKKPEGGTVSIRTKCDDGCYTIIVEDDGVGFEIPRDPEKALGHIGMTSVRNRLEALCSGKLVIHSRPDSGTRVEITIRKEPNHEHPDR